MSLRTISSVSEVLALFKKGGHSEYGGEEVTQLQHALQTAQFAEKENSPVELVVAALLHDFGWHSPHPRRWRAGPGVEL